MNLLLHLIGLFLFIVLTINILSGGLQYKRILRCPDKEGYYEMSSMTFYLIFIIVTGPLFLGSLSLLKYAVYFITLIALLSKGSIKIVRHPITLVYWIFYAWLAIRGLGTPAPYDAIMLLIKYLLPILSLYLGYAAINNRYDFFYVLKFTMLWVLFYTFFIGGLSAKFYSWLYFSPLAAPFLKYAGFADYLNALFVIPFILAWWTGYKKWYWFAIAMFVSTLLEAVRTGLGGMTIALSLFFLFRYKLKSLPMLLIIACSAIAVVLYVPEVNEKFFGENAGKITSDNIIYDDALSLDNIQTNSRTYMWQLIEDNCYVGHEVFGTGLGNSVAFLKNLNNNNPGMPAIMHNDYLQIMCDTGIIGLSLFIAFLASILFIIGKDVWLTKNQYIKYSGIAAIGSMGGIAFSLGFDNVVSHSMSSLIMPFIFIGIYIKIRKLAINGQISE